MKIIITNEEYQKACELLESEGATLKSSALLDKILSILNIEETP